MQLLFLSDPDFCGSLAAACVYLFLRLLMNCERRRFGLTKVRTMDQRKYPALYTLCANLDSWTLKSRVCDFQKLAALHPQ